MTQSVRARALTNDEITTYRTDGVVHIPGFADDVTVERMLADADAQMTAPPGPYTENLTTQGVFFQDRDIYRHRPAFRDWVMSSNVAEQAGRAMGAHRVQFYFDHLFILDPDSAKDQYYWHQDQPYWGAAGDDICSFWLALTDCGADSGALEFVRGTDHGPLYEPVAFGDNSAADHDGTTASGLKTITDQPAYHEHPDDYEIIGFEVTAGDAILFNTKIMHSSRGNHSPSQRRVAYSTRWLGDDATFQPKPGFQDPLTYPEEGFAVGESMSKSTKFPMLWTAGRN